MSEGQDIIKLFNEEQLVDGQPVAGELSASQKREFDLLKLIWDESSEFDPDLSFKAEDAWNKVSKRTAAPVEDLKPKEQQQQPSTPARVIPLRRYAVSAAAVLLILIVGARVLMQDNGVADYKTFTSAEEARSYAYNSLMPIAETVLSKAQNEAFESRVHDLAGQRFDGETTVLLEDLADEMPLRKKFAEKLAAFRNIDGNNYYPQIFIPDYENYYQKEGEPVVVIYVTDQPSRDGTFSYMGYKMGNGGLVEYAMIDEAALQQERVWVLSINENVDNLGELPPTDFGGQMVSNTTGGRIDKLAVYQAHESWAGGASELRIRGVTESWNGLDANGQVGGSPTIVSTSLPRGVRVANLTRSDIGSEIEIDYPLHVFDQQNGFLEGEVQLAFVLFEADVWPNPVNEATYTLANGEPRMFTYCSAQQHYDVGSVFTTRPPDGWNSPVYPAGIPDTHFISTFSRSNSYIRYNTETY